MRVLFISGEIFPFAKSGGLGDVAASLPKALQNYCDITSIMPLYRSIDKEKYRIQSTGFHFHFSLNQQNYHFEIFKADRVLFLKSYNHLFDREEMYGDYEDNDLRFGLFCYAILEYIKASGEQYDILHINDWQSALVALLAKEHYGLTSKIIFTIHNLAYQGVFSKESIQRLGLRWDYFTPSVLEYYDQVNFLKGAIALSDVITTVSPTYAKEIQTKEFGCSLEYFIQENSYKLEGILNGIDYEEFSPDIDPYLSIHYNGKDLSFKKENKQRLLKELFLENEHLPLFIFIGRFTAQKGIDQIIAALESLQHLPINIAILGSGEEHYNHTLATLSDRFSNVSITIGYNEALARRMYASADFLYMPSLYEPCGLNQMIAMRYGTIPIVKETGGLKDSVADFESNDFEDKGIGITFKGVGEEELLHATKRALALFNQKERYHTIVSYDMQKDFSWKNQAKRYVELYDKLQSGWTPKRMIKEFSIPTHYGLDLLKTIAINPKTLYTYWEVTPSLVESYQTSFEALKLRAFANGRLLEEVDLYYGIGDYYFYHAIDFQRVWSEIGFYQKDGTFVTILRSNDFIAPNGKLITTDHVVWRNLATRTLKKSVFEKEYQKLYTYYEPLSSKTIVHQKRFVEKYLTKDNTNNSTTLHTKGEK